MVKFDGVNIDQLIEALLKVKEVHGNINVKVNDECGRFKDVGYISVYNNEVYIEE